MDDSRVVVEMLTVPNAPVSCLVASHILSCCIPYCIILYRDILSLGLQVSVDRVYCYRVALYWFMRETLFVELYVGVLWWFTWRECSRLQQYLYLKLYFYFYLYFLYYCITLLAAWR